MTTISMKDSERMPAAAKRENCRQGSVGQVHQRFQRYHFISAAKPPTARRPVPRIQRETQRFTTGKSSLISESGTINIELILISPGRLKGATINPESISWKQKRRISNSDCCLKSNFCVRTPFQ